MGHHGVDHRLNRAWRRFIIPCQPTIGGQPGKGAFDQPTVGQPLKAAFSRVTLDHFQGQLTQLHGQVDGCAAVAAIRPQVGQPREARLLLNRILWQTTWAGVDFFLHSLSC